MIKPYFELIQYSINNAAPVTVDILCPILPVSRLKTVPAFTFVTKRLQNPGIINPVLIMIVGYRLDLGFLDNHALWARYDVQLTP